MFSFSNSKIVRFIPLREIKGDFQINKRKSLEDSPHSTNILSVSSKTKCSLLKRRAGTHSSDSVWCCSVCVCMCVYTQENICVGLFLFLSMGVCVCRGHRTTLGCQSSTLFETGLSGNHCLYARLANH